MKNLDLSSYEKKHDYLICIDSDGTVIDAMAAKHNHCHGPALVSMWNLHQHAADAQDLWNSINLYSTHRGVNRFIALAIFLEEVDGVWTHEPHLSVLKDWAENSGNLSNEGLVEEIKKNPDPILRKALLWSYDINERILKLSHTDKPPYEGVRDFFEKAKGQVDFALISSSNMSALLEEWGNHDLLKYLDVLTSQEIGTKGECIRRLIEKGYDPKKVLMVGDANPDLEAANSNNAYFYPILTQHETQSWEDLQNKFFTYFTKDLYASHQSEIIEKFKNNLLVGI
jgi:beta-phosphoglucomutase-like phosphatase (HAD superfamily)